MKFKQFKQEHKRCAGYYKIAACDIEGFARKGHSLYGNCDDMEVVRFTHHADNTYTVELRA